MTSHDKPKLRCSVGVTAHNEEQNIEQCLRALQNQLMHEVEISEIIVVASGCTDRTHEIVLALASDDPRIQLITQPERQGKTSAINLFLAACSEAICVLESGDTIPNETAIEHLVRMFRDPKVGMTGAQKVPVNTPDHITEYLSFLRLKMEHELCLEIPRLGELIAFRKVFDSIPTDVAMDEAFVEAIVEERNMEVRYAPDAVVYNMGPKTISDFIKQRRRNHAGHLHLKQKYGYKVSSLNSQVVARVALLQAVGALRLIGVLGLLALIEAWARILGSYDYYVRGKRHEVWDIAWSTKQVDRTEFDARNRRQFVGSQNGSQSQSSAPIKEASNL
ncbi:MAG: glycosyltransferase [Ardenticatenales bacterium]|nr:glycosyltransferase [Ardenticatenales bacterium]